MTTHDLSLAARQLSEMEAAYKDTFEAMEAKFAGAQAEAAALRRERDAARAEAATLQAERRELDVECTHRAQEAAEARAKLKAAYEANDALKQRFHRLVAQVTEIGCTVHPLLFDNGQDAVANTRALKAEGETLVAQRERDSLQKLSAERISELVSRDLVQRAESALDEVVRDEHHPASVSPAVLLCHLLLKEALGR
jgi:septal ring factor EnvC (AmiA/AmiB activator)